MRGCAQIMKEKQPFQRAVVSREEALAMFQENKFKVEIISGLPADAIISLYRCGPMASALFPSPSMHPSPCSGAARQSCMHTSRLPLCRFAEAH